MDPLLHEKGRTTTKIILEINSSPLSTSVACVTKASQRKKSSQLIIGKLHRRSVKFQSSAFTRVFRNVGFTPCHMMNISSFNYDGHKCILYRVSSTAADVWGMSIVWIFYHKANGNFISLLNFRLECAVWLRGGVPNVTLSFLQLSILIKKTVLRESLVWTCYQELMRLYPQTQPFYDVSKPSTELSCWYGSNDPQKMLHLRLDNAFCGFKFMFFLSLVRMFCRDSMRWCLS